VIELVRLVQGAHIERGELLWTPSAEVVERSNLTHYMRWLEEMHGVEAGADYHTLWRWSVSQLEDFWASIWSYFGVRASRPYDRVLVERTMPGAQWFTNTKLNFAEHVLEGKPAGRTAVLHASELRELDEMNWAGLREAVISVAGGLRDLGVERGDRVAAYMPNIPEAVVAFLATASIGAIWSSCSPDFGPGSVVDRFSQIEPKVLFCVDGYSYGGRPFGRTEQLATILTDL
jgi:acetoacetyl-CoA synthetase